LARLAGAICGAAILLVSALAGGPRLQIPAPVVYLAIFAGATWPALNRCAQKIARKAGLAHLPARVDQNR
jgi:hypothetical protein